jgi:hypothetical protein
VDIDEFERGTDVGVCIAVVFEANSLTSLINSVIRCSLDFNAIVKVLTYKRKNSFEKNIFFYLLVVRSFYIDEF